MVIGLREDEVFEIKKTGKLTSTKMFGNTENPVLAKSAGTASLAKNGSLVPSVPVVPGKEGLTSK